MTILLFMSTHLRNPKVKEWFTRRMQPICDDYLVPMLKDEGFYERI